METQSSQKPLPFFYVGKEITTQRVNNYAAKKHNILTDALGKPDTKSIWYSKEHLQGLLEEIEMVGGDGMRVYFGMYEDSHDSFAGQLCLLMVCTRATKDGRKDIVLENEPGFQQRSSLKRGDVAFPGSDDSLKDRDYNYGSPCPPRCNP